MRRPRKQVDMNMANDTEMNGDNDIKPNQIATTCGFAATFLFFIQREKYRQYTDQEVADIERTVLDMTKLVDAQSIAFDKSNDWADHPHLLNRWMSHPIWPRYRQLLRYNLNVYNPFR